MVETNALEMKTSLEKTAKSMDKAIEKIEKAMQELKKGINSAVTTIRNALKKMELNVNGTFSRIEQIGIKAAIAIKRVTGDMAAAFSRIMHASKGLEADISDLGRVTEKAGGKIKEMPITLPIDELNIIPNVSDNRQGSLDDHKNIDVDIRNTFLLQNCKELGKNIAKVVNIGLQKVYNVTVDITLKDEEIKLKPFGQKLSVNFQRLIDSVNGYELGNILENEFMAAWRMAEDFIDEMWKINPDTFLTGWEELGIILAETIYEISESIDFEKVGTTLANGFNGIVEVFRSFNNQMAENNTWQKIADSISKGLNNVIDGIHLAEAGQELGKFMTNLLETLLYVAETTPWYELGRKIGQFLTNIPWATVISQVFGIITNVLGEFFGGLAIEILSHLGEIGTSLANGLNFVFEELRNLATSVPWDFIAVNIHTGLNNMIHGIDWAGAGETLSDFVVKLLGIFQEVAQKTDWEGFARGIGELLSNIDWMGILGQVFDTLWDVFKSCIDGLFDTSAGKVILGFSAGFLAVKGIFQGFDTSSLITEVLSGMGNEINEQLISIMSAAIFRIVGEDGLFSELLTGAIELVSQLGPILNSIGSVIFSPAGLLITGIAAGVVLIISNWDKIKEAAEIIWIGISEFLQTTWNFISEMAAIIWDGISEFFGGIWNGIKEVAETVWVGISEFLQMIWSFISEAAVVIWNEISEFFGRVWNGMKEVAEDLWTDISKFLQEVWEGIRNTAEAVWNEISGFLEGIWNRIKGTAETVWNTVSVFLRGVWEGIKNVAEVTWESISSFLEDAWNGIKNVAEEIWGGIKGFFSDTWEGLKTKAKDASDSIGKFFSDAWDGIKNKTRDTWNSVTETIGSFAVNVYEKVRDVPEKVYGAVKNTAGKMQDAGKGLISGVVEGISSTAGKAYDAISSVAGNLVNSFKNKLGIHSPSRTFMLLADYMIQGLVKGTDDEENNILNKMSELAENIIKPFDRNIKLSFADCGSYSIAAWEFGTVSPDRILSKQGGLFEQSGSEYIMNGIEEAAYRGFARASAENTREEDLLEKLIEAVKEGKSITIDGREIVTTYDKWKNRIGWGF